MIQNKLYRNKKWLLKQLLKGRTRKEIAQFSNCAETTLDHWISKHGLKGFKNYFSKGKDFSEIDPHFGYLVGLFATDGYYNNKTKIVEITLHAQDRKILKYLGEYYKCKVSFYGAQSNKVRLYMSRLQSKKFMELTKFPLKAKTFDVKISNNFHPIIKKFVIRGFIDGDGTIRPESGRIRFYSESPYLIKYLTDYLDTYNFKWTLQEKNKVVYICQESSLIAGIQIYNNFPNISIKRKRDKIKKLVDDIVRTYQMINDKKWCN